MNGAAADLEQVFRADLERIANGFIEAFGLAFADADPNLSYPPYRWLEFVLLRYVPPTPRRVFLSRGFWRRAAEAPEEVRSAMDNFAQLVRRGEDVNAHQGRGLTAHDISSGTRQNPRTDLLLADFGIHHFHMTDKPVAPGAYSSRSDWLLFAVVRADTLLCVDLKRHPKGVGWAQKDVLKTAVQNWPGAFAEREVKGVTGGEWSDADITRMRTYGGNATHRVGTRVYGFLGGGLTSAGTPVRVHWMADRIQLEIEGLARQFTDQNNAAVQFCRDRGVQEPKFRLVLTSDGIAVREEATLVGVPLTAWPGLSAFVPPWAISRLDAEVKRGSGH